MSLSRMDSPWHSIKNAKMLSRRTLWQLWKTFIRTVFLDFWCNATFITMIPKHEGTDVISNFKPISFVGSVYKIIVKILTYRLKVLYTVISRKQGAF